MYGTTSTGNNNSTSNNETSTWTNTPPVYSTSMTTMSSMTVPPFTGFDPGPSTSSGIPPQSHLFHFPAYPSVPVPFDYPQVKQIFVSCSLNNIKRST